IRPDFTESSSAGGCRLTPGSAAADGLQSRLLARGLSCRLAATDSRAPGPKAVSCGRAEREPSAPPSRAYMTGQASASVLVYTFPAFTARRKPPMGHSELVVPYPPSRL